MPDDARMAVRQRDLELRRAGVDQHGRAVDGGEWVGRLPFGVWARRQTQGRGQRRNAWWSDEGSLTFTLALDPVAHGLRLDQEPRLALATAVSLIEAVSAMGLVDPGIGVRWPNDVELGARKLGGILPERVETETGDRILIGVGLNVATRTDLAPPAVARMATSLSALQPSPLSDETVPNFLEAFLRRFPVDLARLAADDPGLADQWARLDVLRDCPIRVALGPRTLIGTARGIDPHGALIVEDGRETHHLFGGQVLRES